MGVLVFFCLTFELRDYCEFGVTRGGNAAAKTFNYGVAGNYLNVTNIF